MIILYLNRQLENVIIMLIKAILSIHILNLLSTVVIKFDFNLDSFYLFETYLAEQLRIVKR